MFSAIQFTHAGWELPHVGSLRLWNTSAVSLIWNCTTQPDFETSTYDLWSALSQPSFCTRNVLQVGTGVNSVTAIQIQWWVFCSSENSFAKSTPSVICVKSCTSKNILIPMWILDHNKISALLSVFSNIWPGCFRSYVKQGSALLQRRHSRTIVNTNIRQNEIHYLKYLALPPS